MSVLKPDFVEKLRSIRTRVPRDAWLKLAEKFRAKSEGYSPGAAAELARATIHPDQVWALSQVLKTHETPSWTDLASAFEVIEAWVSCTPTTLNIVWSGPANGTFPIRRFDQVLYDLLSKAEHRIFLVTFAAHRVPLLCQHLADAIGRGVNVTLLLESEKSSAGQLSHDAAKAFKEVPLNKIRLLHWPLEKRERNQADKPGKLHIKCALVDQAAIIGSANLTDDAFNRNMEMGVIIRDPATVNSIENHFETLLQNGNLERV